MTASGTFRTGAVKLTISKLTWRLRAPRSGDDPQRTYRSAVHCVAYVSHQAMWRTHFRPRAGISLMIASLDYRSAHFLSPAIASLFFPSSWGLGFRLRDHCPRDLPRQPLGLEPLAVARKCLLCDLVLSHCLSASTWRNASRASRSLVRCRRNHPTPSCRHTPCRPAARRTCRPLAES